MGWMFNSNTGEAIALSNAEPYWNPVEAAITSGAVDSRTGKEQQPGAWSGDSLTGWMA
ncbi:hypothetical protein AWB73_02845 [Caballeronia turbans]|nr:hypothetical protein AWB73_02845 [Caballeronia turbans]